MDLHQLGRRFLAACALGTILACAGCSGGRAAVSGTVLVDHEPLVEGSINFIPADGNTGPSIGAVISNGNYHIPRADGVVLGANRVEIRGFKKSGRKIPDRWKKGEMLDETVRAVPAEFNSRSTLVRAIEAGENTLDFDLPGIKSKK